MLKVDSAFFGEKIYFRGRNRMNNYRLSYMFKEKELQKLIKLTHLDERTITEELSKINRVSENFFGKKVTQEKGELMIPDVIWRRWPEILFGEKKIERYVSETQRQSMIYLLAFSTVEDLSVFGFQELFCVSKNTILKDLKSLRSELKKSNINLLYSRKKGFFLEGEEYRIRSIAYSKISLLVAEENGEWLLFEGIYSISDLNYVTMRDDLSTALTTFEMTIVPSRFEEILYFINYLVFRITQKEIAIEREDRSLLESLKTYQASKEFLSSIEQIKNSEEEIFYLTMVLQSVIQGDLKEDALEFLLERSSKIIHKMERLAAVQFVGYQEFLLNFFYHLVPAYFRIRYDFSLNNVLIEEIKVQYKELYELTHRALGPLQQLVGEIPDIEIGYFTILFGGEIRKQKESQNYQRLKAMVVCPSGISSSLIMKSELQSLFPQIEFLPAMSTREYESYHFIEETDLVFSSVPIKTASPNYVIRPIMTPLEKNELVKKVNDQFFSSVVGMNSIDDLLEVIFPYIELKKGVTKKKLRSVLQRKINKELNRREDQRPMLSELLTKETIQFTDQQLTWKEAIAKAAEPLEKEKKIEERYITAMIDKVIDYGPFIHIGKGIALPHARPEDGVNEIGMSLLKVQEPVLLNEDEQHPIELFICLAAIDNEMHLKALASLTKILSDKDKLAALLTATNSEEIIEVIKKGEDEE